MSIPPEYITVTLKHLFNLAVIRRSYNDISMFSCHACRELKKQTLNIGYMSAYDNVFNLNRIVIDYMTIDRYEAASVDIKTSLMKNVSIELDGMGYPIDPYVSMYKRRPADRATRFNLHKINDYYYIANKPIFKEASLDAKSLRVHPYYLVAVFITKNMFLHETCLSTKSLTWYKKYNNATLKFKLEWGFEFEAIIFSDGNISVSVYRGSDVETDFCTELLSQVFLKETSNG